MEADDLVIAGRRFSSRLLVGSGKYASAEIARASVEASGAEIVTAALRRLPADGRTPRLVDVLDPERYLYLPNSAGCYSAAEAVRLLRLAREAGDSPWVKLEVIGDRETLYPDMEETLAATRELAADGFVLLVYSTDDPVACRKLEEAGAAAVMPLAAPIGSGQGILNPRALATIVARARVPVIVDAGLGTPSDATRAMEIGADAVLLNTALAAAGDPVRMAEAFRHAVIAGRTAFLAGRMPMRASAVASSPAPDPR